MPLCFRRIAMPIPENPAPTMMILRCCGICSTYSSPFAPTPFSLTYTSVTGEGEVERALDLRATRVRLSGRESSRASHGQAEGLSHGHVGDLAALDVQAPT